MIRLLSLTATACCIVELIWALPGPYPLDPRSIPAIAAGTGAPQTTAISGSQSNIIITTTDSQATYTLTYLPPTSIGTGTGSTTQSWGLDPPIVPISFPVPPVVNPPYIPPEEPGQDEPTKKISLTATSATDCFTMTATISTVSCTELLWVSSYQLQSTLTDCSSTFSTTEGCLVTPSATTMTSYIDIPEVTSSADSETEDNPGQIYLDPNPPDNPNKVSDIFIHDFGLLPGTTSPGDLVCAAQATSGPSFIQVNALLNVMDFCSGGINITGLAPISNEYRQPTGGSQLSIQAIHLDSDVCYASEPAHWDEARCKYLVNRPIFECEPDSNPQTQIAKYGGTITADCLEVTLTPQSVPESVFCGAFDDGGGMGFKAFTPDEANDAIDKYCNSDTYTADPSYDTTPYGVRIIGYALDRFWYKNGVYCMTTSPRPPPPNIPADQSACHSDGSMDFELDVGVKFKTDQTGCQPMKPYVVPRGDECVNTLKKVVSGCNLGAPDFGGKVDDDSDSGCLEWWVYAAGSQI